MAHIKICKEPDCKDAATTEGFCRLHYLLNWKRLKEERRKRQAKKLNRYIENICRSHPDRYLEKIKKDIRSPKFDNYIEENFGFGKEEEEIFDEGTYEEEIEQLIKQLKIEKGF